MRTLGQRFDFAYLNVEHGRRQHQAFIDVALSVLERAV